MATLKGETEKTKVKKDNVAWRKKKRNYSYKENFQMRFDYRTMGRLTCKTANEKKILFFESWVI